MNSKQWLLIKSGYYIVPSLSTTLVTDKNLANYFVYWVTSFFWQSKPDIVSFFCSTHKPEKIPVMHKCFTRASSSLHKVHIF